MTRRSPSEVVRSAQPSESDGTRLWVGYGGKSVPRIHMPPLMIADAGLQVHAGCVADTVVCFGCLALAEDRRDVVAIIHPASLDHCVNCWAVRPSRGLLGSREEGDVVVVGLSD